MTESQNEVQDAPVVMKFGGSSVADAAHLERVATIVAARAQARRVVVVVSAMGKATNRLVDQAKSLCTEPPARELDMLLTTGERHSMALLAMAIAARGLQAISLTGSQCGIITNHEHGRARIVELRPFRILDELAAGHIVIVGGFQGVSYKREVTTLGRGGSDTTAVALAAALGADCEIYSDVDGIYSADPRQVNDARRLDIVDFDEMEALARAGAKVLHAEAIRLARERDIVIYARSTKDAANGGGAQSVVRHAAGSPPGVRAVASDAAIRTLELHIDPPTEAVVSMLYRHLSGLGLRYLRVDASGCKAVVSETSRDDLDLVDRVLAEISSTLETNDDVLEIRSHSRSDLGLVTCVGSGIEQDGEVAARAMDTLAEIGIRPAAILTDTHSLAFAVLRDLVDAATSALHARLVSK